MLDTRGLRFRRRAYCPLIEGFEMVSEKDWHIQFGRYQRAQKRRRLAPSASIASVGCGCRIWSCLGLDLLGSNQVQLDA
jgi:hypothetical protein